LYWQPTFSCSDADAEKALRALSERGGIIRAMQRAMSGQPRELAMFEPGDDARCRDRDCLQYSHLRPV
jgi:hypothetical protein